MAGEIPRFGTYYEEPILPPSKQRELITVEQLQERYPFRYKIYEQGEKRTELDNGLSPEVLLRRLQILNNLDRHITLHGGPGKGRVLREKQLAVFRDISIFLEKGETEGFVEAPTGFGKTVLFSEVIRATDQRTLVVVPSRILVEQTYHALRRFNPALNIGRYYSDKKERDNQVTVTTYQSLIISCGGVKPEDVDLLILDEVHQSLTDARIQAVGHFPNPVKLGFTATPEYTQDKRVENLLNNEIHTVTLKEAVETGLLCSFSVYLAETDVDLSSVKIDDDGDYNERDLEEAVNIYSRNKSAIDLYKKLNSDHSGLSKAVTYCVSIKHAKEVARLFNEEGIPAGVVWSDQDPDERRKTLEAYKRGDVKVLTNVNVLTEGFDDPQAALCLNLRPTLSKVVAKQRGGRVLRLDPSNPHKHAVVVDYLDRNENKRTLQVTFAQVAEGAKIINPVDVGGNGGTRGGNGGGNGGTVVGGEEDPFDLEHLHVITNSQEVLRIINELEATQTRDLLEVQPDDFAVSPQELFTTFIGSYKKLRPIADIVLKELYEQDAALFALRKRGSQQVSACVNRSLFINKMLEKGVELRDTSIDKVLDSDFTFTQPNLIDTFVGDYNDHIQPIAREVFDVLVATHPETLVVKRGYGRMITVIADPDIFIQLMEERGVKLRSEKPGKVKEAELIISRSSLAEKFIGDPRKLMSAADKAVQIIMEESPTQINKRFHGSSEVTVCVDPVRFIQLMRESGISLQSEVKGNVSDTDFRITTHMLKDLFIGHITLVSDTAREVQAVHPELFELKRGFAGKSTYYVTVCKDKAFFIEEMQRRGRRLKTK